jgi:hypothetical protein
MTCRVRNRSSDSLTPDDEKGIAKRRGHSYRSVELGLRAGVTSIPARDDDDAPLRPRRGGLRDQSVGGQARPGPSTRVGDALGRERARAGRSRGPRGSAAASRIRRPGRPTPPATCRCATPATRGGS